MRLKLPQFKFKRPINWFAIILFVISFGLLFVFVILPILNVFIGAFWSKNQWSFGNFFSYWKISSNRKGLSNSLLAGLFTTILSSLIGVPIAYLMTRYRFTGRRGFQILLTLPLVLPPFIGAFAMLVMLGRNGIVTNFLRITLNLALSEGFIQPNLQGLVLVQATHLWPLIYLNTSAALSKIDPSLEESARNLGASGIDLFRRITFPLALPGFVAGALLVFVWSISDIGTPIMLNFPNYAPAQAFWELVRIDGIVEFSYVICFILTLISAVSLVVINRFVGLKAYATARIGAAPRVLIKHVKGKIVPAIWFVLLFILGFSIIPHIGTTIIAFTVLPGYGQWIPKGITLDGWRTVIAREETSFFIINSVIYASLAALIDIVLGALIGYLLARKNFPGKSVLDIVSMMPLAIPGVVIGLGYLRFFSAPLFGSTFRLSSIWFILVISYSMRRLPYAVRSSHAVLQQIHVSLEEASLNLGASRIKTFLKITLPLMTAGLVAGGTMAFITAFTEVSTSLMIQPLYGPFGVHARPITLGIYFEILRGAGGYAPAGCLGMIQIVVAILGFYITNRVLGEQVTIGM